MDSRRPFHALEINSASTTWGPTKKANKHNQESFQRSVIWSDFLSPQLILSAFPSVFAIIRHCFLLWETHTHSSVPLSHTASMTSRNPLSSLCITPPTHTHSLHDKPLGFLYLILDPFYFLPESCKCRERLQLGTEKPKSVCDAVTRAPAILEQTPGSWSHSRQRSLETLQLCAQELLRGCWAVDLSFPQGKDNGSSLTWFIKVSPTRPGPS